MGTLTDFLKLVKPYNNEYQNTWDQPMNENSDKLDIWAEAIFTEIYDARFGKPSLSEFLEVGHNPDGTLKPTEEGIAARNSFIYGDETVLAEDFELADRLKEADKEVFAAREGRSNIRLNLAAREFEKGEVVSGAKDGNGYPTWLGYTGINAQLDGSTTPIWMKISGLMARVRNQKQIAISGLVGTKYLYAEHDPINGELLYDGDSSSPPPADPNGTIGSDGTKVKIFEDLTQDFVSMGIEPGDILEILGTSSNAGKYLVDEVAPSGNNQRLKIKGVFPGGVQASLDYNLWDPTGVTLGFEDTKTPATNKFHFGEASWDGVGITAVRTIPFGDVFIGEWRGIDVSGGSPTFEETWNHNMLDDALEVHVQVSQANDGSLPVEMLSLGTFTNTLGVSINNTITLTPNTPQVLSGSVSSALTGSIYMDRSVYARWTKYQVSVKNAVSAVFYKDYTGALKQTGYIRVILSKIRK